MSSASTFTASQLAIIAWRQEEIATAVDILPKIEGIPAKSASVLDLSTVSRSQQDNEIDGPAISQKLADEDTKWLKVPAELANIAERGRTIRDYKIAKASRADLLTAALRSVLSRAQASERVIKNIQPSTK